MEEGMGGGWVVVCGWVGGWGGINKGRGLPDGGRGKGGAITTITTTTPLSLTLDTEHSHVVTAQIGKHVPLS